MTARVTGLTLLGIVVLGVMGASVLAPNLPTRQFRGYLHAPPMRPRLVDANGVHWPFVHPLRLVDRLERRYEADTSCRLPLVWFRGGRLVQLADPGDQPLLLLGSDQLGRDVFARLLHGGRASLGVAAFAVLGALLIGAMVGAVSGAAGGFVDEMLMRFADFVLVLPAICVVLAVRAVMPLVMPTGAIVLLMAGVFAAVGWPFVARGVRAIVATERQKTYALAAISIGVGPVGLVRRHLLPAAYGFLRVQATLLLPAFVLTEATLSFVGLGFAEPTASWGVMLQEASNIRGVADFPWLLSPAAAIAAVVFAVNLIARAGEGHEPLGWVLPRR